MWHIYSRIRFHHALNAVMRVLLLLDNAQTYLLAHFASLLDCSKDRSWCICKLDSGYIVCAQDVG